MFTVNFNTAVKTNDLDLYVCVYLYQHTYEQLLSKLQHTIE